MARKFVDDRDSEAIKVSAQEMDCAGETIRRYLPYSDAEDQLLSAALTFETAADDAPGRQQVIFLAPSSN